MPPPVIPSGKVPPPPPMNLNAIASTKIASSDVDGTSTGMES
jgi:hypothetical protein